MGVFLKFAIDTEQHLYRATLFAPKGRFEKQPSLATHFQHNAGFDSTFVPKQHVRNPLPPPYFIFIKSTEATMIHTLLSQQRMLSKDGQYPITLSEIVRGF